MDCPDDQFYFCRISGECLPRNEVERCDGISQCSDGSDEFDCSLPSDPNGGLTDRDIGVATTIVIPTILACVILVIGMLIGIHKCRQWEADRIIEMRRTRRIVQRLTARLREKNFNTLQKARRLRKRQTTLMTGCQETTTTPGCGSNNDDTVTGALLPTSGSTGSSTRAPPRYDSEPPFLCTHSPPPTYEDAILDTLYMEFVRPCRRSTSRVSIF